MLRLVPIAFAVGLLCLASCTTAQQNLATDAVSLVVTSAAAVDPAISPMLSSAAKVACDGQAVANAAGDSQLSQVLGVACTW